MNNTKKTLKILEIMFPQFTKRNSSNGEVDETTPFGYAVWFFGRCFGLIGAVWERKENEDLSLGLFFINLIFTIIAVPFLFLIWATGNLIFVMNYDKRNKTHMFPLYVFVLICVIALSVLFVDYTTQGKITTNINNSITDTVDSIQNTQPSEEPRTRNVTRNVTEESSEPIEREEQIVVPDEVAYSEENNTDSETAEENIENEVEIVTEMEVPVVVNDEQGVKIERSIGGR